MNLVRKWFEGNVCNSCKSSPCLASFCSAFLCCLGFSLHILLPLYTNISSDIDHILYSYTSLRMSSIERTNTSYIEIKKKGNTCLKI